MATISCSVGQNSSYYSVYIEYSYTQSVAKNESYVTAALKLKQLDNYYDFDTVGNVTVSFVMNGKTYSKTARVNIDDKGNAGSIFTLVDTGGAITIPHDANGTKTITFSCSCAIDSAGWGPGNITLSSKSVTLTTISRPTTVDKITDTSGSTISSANVDTSIRVYYTPKSSTLYNRLYYYIDDVQKGYINLGRASSQTSYTLAINSSWVLKSSATLKCAVYTYSDSGYSSSIGNNYTSITVNVPSTDNYQPTVSLTYTPTYGHSLKSNNEGFYIQGVSKITLTSSGGAGTGASIKSLEIKQGTSVIASSSSSPLTKTSLALNTSGSTTFKATVTDTRGRSKDSSNVSINVLPYSMPTLTNGSVVRCNSSGSPSISGEYILGKITGSVSSLKPNGTEVNTKTIAWKYREAGTSTWYSVNNNITSDTNTKSTTTFNISKNWEFVFTITDAIGNTIDSPIYSVRSSARPINIARYNNGVAIGGFSTVTSNNQNSSKFECEWPATFNQDIVVNHPDFGSKNLRYADTLYGLVSVPGDADFDTYLTPGRYRISTTNATTIEHRPQQGVATIQGGILIVERMGTLQSDYLRQIYEVWGSACETYVRYKNTSGWKPWRRIVIEDLSAGLSIAGNITFENGEQTDERSIYFTNTNGANPHNCQLYGGNPGSATGIGMWDAGNSRRILSYTDYNNRLYIGSDDNQSDTRILGSLTLEGHSTPVGSVISATSTTKSVSSYVSGSSTITNLTSLSIPAGVWVIIGGIYTGAVASSSTGGVVRITLGDTSTSDALNPANNNGYGSNSMRVYGSTTAVYTEVVTIRTGGAATVYLNVLQNTGSTLSITGQIRAVRIV